MTKFSRQNFSRRVFWTVNSFHMVREKGLHDKKKSLNVFTAKIFISMHRNDFCPPQNFTIAKKNREKLSRKAFRFIQLIKICTMMAFSMTLFFFITQTSFSPEEKSSACKSSTWSHFCTGDLFSFPTNWGSLALRLLYSIVLFISCSIVYGFYGDRNLCLVVNDFFLYCKSKFSMNWWTERCFATWWTGQPKFWLYLKFWIRRWEDLMCWIYFETISYKYFSKSTTLTQASKQWQIGSI